MTLRIALIQEYQARIRALMLKQNDCKTVSEVKRIQFFIDDLKEKIGALSV